MKKVGGSAGLAALIKQRTELVQQAQLSGQDVNLPPMIVASNSNSATNLPPASKNTYLPTTTSFNAANKCFMCEKTVYKPEELIAVGRVWHDKCFTCGGKNSDGCGRVMKRDGYLDHDGQPYCNACYNKNFRTKGFGYGNSLNTNYGLGSKSNESVGGIGSNSADSQSGMNRSSPPPLGPRSISPPKPPAAPPAPPAPPKPAAPPALPAPVRSFSPPKPPAAPPAPPAPPAPTRSLSPPKSAASFPTTSVSGGSSVNRPLSPPKYTPTNNATVHSASAPKCTSCAKTVYKMEEVIAVGRVWHSSCFVCSGTKGDGCKRTLTRDNYVDHENQPYCNACYAKLFRPKGYGNALNTDYGPAPDDVAAAASVYEGQGHAKVSADQGFQKPKAPGRPAHATPVSSAAPSTGKPAGPPPPPPAPPATAANPLIIPVTDGSEIPKGTVKIGGKAGGLYQEASYVGDNDEVDESEW